ncbi:hypothetical protein [Botrimarina sp.]|uniref:hypothetical protein n=1 Tax=Botrimarina sp. TaxID=2795802 RepID=UPI0032EE8311
MLTGSHKTRRPSLGVAALVLAAAGVASTGCQVDIGGQMLPSPYYLTDDVQYYEPGPEFKLANEAAALRAAAEARDSELQ